MERLNKIFADWAKEDKKTELASEKIELGLVDDLNKALENSDSLIKDIQIDNKRIVEMEKFKNKKLKEETKLYEKRDKAADKYFKLEDQFLNAKSVYEDSIQQIKNSEDNIARIEDEVLKAEKSKAPKAKKAQSLLGVFDKNLQKAEAAAKDLGIKLPIAKYKKAQDNLRKSIS